MNEDTRPVFNIAELPEVTEREGEWGASYRVLTPNMRARGGGPVKVELGDLVFHHDEDVELH